MKTRFNAGAIVLASGIFFCAAAGAAGGHFAVDDAAILDTGQCKIDSWLTRSRDSERLLHLGTDSRVRGQGHATRPPPSSDC